MQATGHYLNYRQVSNISALNRQFKLLITQMQLEHRVSALLQLHLRYVAQRQLQAETRYISVLGFGAYYIRYFTVMMTWIIGPQWCIWSKYSFIFKSKKNNSQIQNNMPDEIFTATCKPCKRDRCIIYCDATNDVNTINKIVMEGRCAWFANIHTHTHTLVKFYVDAAGSDVDMLIV